jgi:hypothetical protein
MSRISKSKQGCLFEHFAKGTTAGYAAESIDINQYCQVNSKFEDFQKMALRMLGLSKGRISANPINLTTPRLVLKTLK